MGHIAKRLEELGLTLPPCPAPVGNYVVAQKTGNLIYAAGQAPVLADGSTLYPGRVGETVTPEEGYQAARLAGLRLISELASAADLDHVKIIKLNGYVAAAPDFYAVPAVVNGASDLMAEVFGANGLHARTSVGVATLPGNAPVEVELIAEIFD